MLDLGSIITCVTPGPACTRVTGCDLHSTITGSGRAPRTVVMMWTISLSCAPCGSAPLGRVVGASNMYAPSSNLRG